MVLYATTWKAVAGIVVLDEFGNSLLNMEPFSSEGDEDMKSIIIRISVEALEKSTLKVIYYKGGIDDGNAGIAAIAVK